MTDIHPSKETTETTHSSKFAQSQDSVFDVLVIGADQSGLAIGRQLQRRGRPFLIVDAGPETGHVSRSRWDSLTLFTVARYSGLPGLPFPATLFEPWHRTRVDVVVVTGCGPGRGHRCGVRGCLPTAKHRPW